MESVYYTTSIKLHKYESYKAIVYSADNLLSPSSAAHSNNAQNCTVLNHLTQLAHFSMVIPGCLQAVLRRQNTQATLTRFSLISPFFTAQCTLVQMRGLGIACRPSVCPSVCPSVTLVDCDHTGLKSWKLITRTTSPTPSLFVAKRRST